MDKKKNQELKCLETTKEYVTRFLSNKERKYFYSLMPIYLDNEPAERPDFIIRDKEYTYGLEHFLIDFCYDGPQNNQSESKRATRNVLKIYNEYHDPNIGTIKECNTERATKDIENALNDLMALSGKFDYDKYITAFKRTFEQHYSKVDEYKATLEKDGTSVKVGFLIELHYLPCLFYATYNGSECWFKDQNKVFPLTKDIANVIKNVNDLDFVIISQYEEGVPSDARDVKIYDPKDIDKSLSLQNVKLYDKIVYSKDIHKCGIQLIK